MAKVDTKAMTIETVDRQKRYVESQKFRASNLGIVFTDAFLRGMRDLGYRSPSTAIAEDIDNSFQAAANMVSLRFGFKSKNESKPDMLAIVDNGNGMIPEMISFAVRWGGTDRENDRKGFGRYGYGLPSSAVSLAKRYTVYSKTSEHPWHSVAVDLEELAASAYDIEATKKLLSARPGQLPKWLVDAETIVDLKSLNSGTVIIFEELDRLNSLSGWTMRNTIKGKLLKDFGVIYRHFIPERRIFVDGTETEAVDPLFLMEHGRFYAETPVMAERVEARTIEMETSRGTKGTISIRASLLPPDFTNPLPPPPSKKPPRNNNRFEILADYNGLLICRENRQIDCIPPRWTKFQNNDRYVKVEVNFDPELDEYFGITTTKQQITVTDEMWEKLQHSGANGGALMDLVDDIRKRFRVLHTKQEAELQNKRVEKPDDEDIPRRSVRALEATAKFKNKVPEPTEAQLREANKNLENEAERRSRLSKKPKEEELRELKTKIAQRRWDIVFESIPEGPFYRPQRLGEQKLVIINTDHPFYTKIYAAAGHASTAGLEVLLLVLAERELESNPDAELFYKAERQKWSERLRYALNDLLDDQTWEDKAAFVAEILHTAATRSPGDVAA